MYNKKRTFMLVIALLGFATLFVCSASTVAVQTAYAAEKVGDKTIAEAKRLGISIKGLSAAEAKKAVAAAQKKFDVLQDTADTLGISIDGMTLKEAQSEVASAQKTMNQLKKDAKAFNVDIKGLTIAEAQAKLDPARTQFLQTNLTADAEKYGIDISGMSDLEAYSAIQEAISQENSASIDKKLAAEAAKLGIDITGLSTEEANAKIQATYDEMKKENTKDASTYDVTMDLVSGDIDVKKDADNEKLFNELKEEAINLGVDIEGMSLAEAKAAIEAEINEISAADSGQSDSAQLNQFLACALAVKKNDESTVMSYVNSGLFEGVKIKMQGLSYEDAKAKIIQVFSSDLGIDIVKSTVSQIKKKFAAAMKQMLKNEAEFYKVDISGLSDTQALAVIDLARSIMMAQNWADLNTYAAALGVDITGLSFEDGWQKVKDFQQAQEKSILEAEAVRLGININGMTNAEAARVIKIADHRNMLLLFLNEANELGIDTSKYLNLSDEDMLNDKIFTQLKEELNKYYEQNGKGNNEPFDLQAMAEKYGVDITGLSVEEATKKVNEAIEASKKGTGK